MTIDAGPHNPYLALMARKHMWRSIACGLLSIFLVALLVTTPLCAARCASSLCPPTTSSQAAERCHHSSPSEGDAPSLGAATKQTCAPPELLFTAPRLENPSAPAASFISFVVVLRPNVVGTFVMGRRPYSSHPPALSDWSLLHPLRF
jgi:hypothetical protein